MFHKVPWGSMRLLQVPWSSFRFLEVPSGFSEVPSHSLKLLQLSWSSFSSLNVFLQEFLLVFHQVFLWVPSGTFRFIWALITSFSFLQAPLSPFSLIQVPSGSSCDELFITLVNYSEKGYLLQSHRVASFPGKPHSLWLETCVTKVNVLSHFISCSKLFCYSHESTSTT